MQKYFLFAFIALLTACSHRKENKPLDLIPAAKMQAILKDIHYADGIANREGEHDGSAEARTRSLYKEVFAKHGVSQKQFFDSFHYYLLHVDGLDSIYNNIIIQISKEQAIIQVDDQ
jgi:hypothetical protein